MFGDDWLNTLSLIGVNMKRFAFDSKYSRMETMKAIASKGSNRQPPTLLSPTLDTVITLDDLTTKFCENKPLATCPRRKKNDRFRPPRCVTRIQRFCGASFISGITQRLGKWTRESIRSTVTIEQTLVKTRNWFIGHRIATPSYGAAHSSAFMCLNIPGFSQHDVNSFSA
uniref:Uncharacterized protein n=1 Tax=Schistocephalus solidus TaxID=70667 RepID=A0A0X3PXH6_SCHSO